MTVPEEVQAMHLRHFDAYISALVTRLTQTDEHYNFITLCERIERLLSIDRQFYESREEPSVVETTPIISPPAEQPALEESRSPAFEEDRNRCPERDKDGNRCLHDAGHRGTHLAAWGLSAGWATATFETPEEEPVKATPTMSAEELRAWEARIDVGDSPQTTQPQKRTRSWTPEQRGAQAARLSKRREEGERIGKPRNVPQSLTKDLENAALLDTASMSISEAATPLPPSPPDEEPTRTHSATKLGDSPAGDLTPEEAAHEDAAAILEALSAVTETPERQNPIATSRPECACPPGWLKPGEAWMATDRALTHRHHKDCPLHRHKHRFGTTPDGDGNITGRCECGHEEIRPLEPARAKVDNRAKAVAS